MDSRRRQAMGLGASILLVVTSLPGCGSAASQAPTNPAPSVPRPSPFTFEVLPARAVGLALPGEKFLFLVRASGAGADGAITVSATTTGGTVSVKPASLEPGAVGEVVLVPAAVTGAEVPVDVEITARRGGIVQTERRTITVQPGRDELQPDADAHLAPFLTWFAANRPDLGISPATPLEPVPGTWVLIVSHYLYFSSDWELNLSWHVMIAPGDWSRLNMRRRWSETTPSRAFEISSVSGGAQPHEIAPEDAVWR